MTHSDVETLNMTTTFVFMFLMMSREVTVVFIKTINL